jgi:hypothetical protein
MKRIFAGCVRAAHNSLSTRQLSLLCGMFSESGTRLAITLRKSFVFKEVRKGEAIFRRLAVLLDYRSPNQGVFSHALAWSVGLNLPIRGLLAPELFRSWGSQKRAEMEGACSGRCAEFKIPFEISVLGGQATRALPQLTGPDDLLALGQALPSVTKKELLRAVASTSAPAVLLCSDAWTPLSRLLIVDQGSCKNARYLRSAAEIGKRLSLPAVVLTTAGSESVARSRQQAAREILADYGSEIDFDFIVGYDIGAAVASVARWRRCQCVLFEQPESDPRWPWPGTTSTDWLTSATASLTLLALPQPALGNGTQPDAAGDQARG